MHLFCFIVLISLFPFPASGQIQQLLRNCSTRDSCVHKCCTVRLAPARLQLASYRNGFFLSILLLPLLFTLADLPRCVWKASRDLVLACVIFSENAAALLLENKCNPG